MKIGRNELCPCGSGKKYKKFCLRKEQNAITAITENDSDIYDIQDDDDDEKFDLSLEDQMRLLGALNNMHEFFLERKPHIKEYKKIRNLHGEVLAFTYTIPSL